MMMLPRPSEVVPEKLRAAHRIIAINPGNPHLETCVFDDGCGMPTCHFGPSKGVPETVLVMADDEELPHLRDLVNAAKS
jgi:hypothetical protein